MLQVKPEHTSLAVDVLDECATTPLTSEDIPLYESARENLFDQYFIGLEGNMDAYADLLLDCIQEGEPTLAEGYFERTEAVITSIDLEELEEVRAQVFKPERMVTVVIEPKA
jgi:hypothetical protein